MVDDFAELNSKSISHALLLPKWRIKTEENLSPYIYCPAHISYKSSMGSNFWTPEFLKCGFLFQIKNVH